MKKISLRKVIRWFGKELLSMVIIAVLASVGWVIAAVMIAQIEHWIGLL